MIAQIQKRYGSVVNFDKTKITNAIHRAAREGGNESKQECDKIAEKVLEKLEKEMPPAAIPTVEGVQDMVEQVLIETGHAKTAKAYIIYRQRRAEIRNEKKLVLEKDEIDDVDKRFDVNALRVLKARYLRKDDKGKLIETPKQLFTRVAVNTALADLFYDERVFDKDANQKQHPHETFEPAMYDDELAVGKYVLNRYHLEAVKRMHDRFDRQGNMKVSWSEFLSMLKEGEFNNHEATADDFYKIMVCRQFMPNTPAIANFGSVLGMGSACYVLGVDDDLTSIMDTLKHTALIHQAGGGTGYNFSKLRPEGDVVKSTCGTASGPISFMTLYDNMTDVIKQGGMRRGANMGILNSNHPDIEKFITAKEGNKALRNFNISVLIMSDFWDYYEKDEPYPLVNPRNGEVVRTVSPKQLFDKLVYQAWESAEPGVIFFDKVNEFNPFLEHLGPIVTTNPCVAGDTKILTENGLIEIKKLAEMEDVPRLLVDARVLAYATGERQLQAGMLAVKAEKIWKTGERETLVLTTESEKKLTATPDHRILTRRGWVQASEIKSGEKVFVQDGSGEPIEEKVTSIAKGKITSVYDITEPLTHSFIANGIIVHNCGEVLLYPNEPCNLGSINVWAFAKEDENGDTYVDWEEMKNVTAVVTHFMDNVIDVNKWPLQQIEDMALATRKIGVGVMGVGDLLFELGLPYNNDDGRAFMEQLMEFVNYWTKVESVELAKSRGSLPYYNKSFYPSGRLPFRGSTQRDRWHFDWSALAEEVKKNGIRNGYTTIIAPTGSISMIAGCSSGIEPVYSLVFEKNVKVGSFFYIDPVFEKIMKREGLYDEDLMKQIAENRGSIQNVPYISQHLKRVFVTAMDATPESHIRALAAFQTWVDSSISKTNNFPANATVEDMRQSYLLAYQLGCKDVTVFRDSSIKEQVLVAPNREKTQEVKKEKYVVVKKTLTETASGTLLEHQNGLHQSKHEYKECPTCSSAALSFKEGCLTCESCGWGLCG